MSKNDEFCVKNEELCIKNEELCFELMDFAGGEGTGGEDETPAGFIAVNGAECHH